MTEMAGVAGYVPPMRDEAAHERGTRIVGLERRQGPEARGKVAAIPPMTIKPS